MIRLIDFILAVLLICALVPIFFVLFFVSWVDVGSPLLIQNRLGKSGKLFILFKFRTMPIDTPFVATHLLESPEISIVGRFLRKYKLDELPQLFNILLGQMSFVGPRPCLPTQIDVIEARLRHPALDVCPGLTGYSQLNGIDMSNVEALVRGDLKTVINLGIKNYFYYLFCTLSGKGSRDSLVRG